MNKIVRMKPTKSHGYKYKYKILAKESTVLSENEKIYYSKLMGIRWFCSILETCILYWSISLTVVLHLNGKMLVSNEHERFQVENKSSLWNWAVNLQKSVEFANDKQTKEPVENRERKTYQIQIEIFLVFWQLHHLQIHVYSYIWTWKFTY